MVETIDARPRMENCDFSMGFDLRMATSIAEALQPFPDNEALLCESIALCPELMHVVERFRDMGESGLAGPQFP